MTEHVKPAAGYLGLTTLEPTLDSSAYFDASHHERELKAIWYRQWIYLCPAAELNEPRAFRTFDVGSQQILLVRDEEGELRAFHNTCRHRGSVLCKEAKGRLRSKLITCPYHAWAYTLQGELKRTPTLSPIEGFDKKDYSLYGVALRQWRGFVFVNLAGDDEAMFENMINRGSDRFDNWPLEELKVGHVYRKVMNCNWKVFWENFSECLHCPGLHPELCEIVPIYGRTISSEKDDPNFPEHAGSTDPKLRGGLREGAETWSMDGLAHGAPFPGLSDTDRAAGQSYLTSLPSVFVVGHLDYVRTVRIMPLGPETTELHAEWLFSETALADPDFDMVNITDFATLVMDQDAAACELNQKGLRSIAHKQGVLMAEEHYVKMFHDWVRNALGEDAG